MNDLNFLGTYGNIREVWTKYPNGGISGDYVIIADVKYRWDKYVKRWRREGDFLESTARLNRIFRADVTVENNLTVSGTLRAKGIKQPNCGFYRTYEGLLEKYPEPEVGYWACVGDTVPGEIYVCEEKGVWKATGETGGIDSLDLDRLDEIEENASLALAGATARFTEFVTGISVINDVAPEKGNKRCVVWDELNCRFLMNVDGNFYTDWDGKQLYYNENGKIRRDKIFVCDNVAYLYNGTTLVDVTENLYNKIHNAGFDGTPDEMYAAFAALLRRTIEFDIEAPARMEHESNIDGFLGPGETATVKFTVWKGYLPITALVTKWSISRDGGDPPSDKVWNASAKAVNFAGVIDLTVDDLSPIQQSTTFTVTAEGSFSEGVVSYNLEF